MKFATRNPLTKIAALAAVLALAATSSFADDATWTNPTTGAWTNPLMWNPGAAPGSTNITTSTDTAYFNDSVITAGTTVNVDANRNIKNIVITNSAASDFRYTLTGGSFKLTDGGGFYMTGTRNGSIGSAIEIQGVGGSATFSNSGGTYTFSAGVSGVSTAGNTTTLYLDGTNTGSLIQGAITDGAAGGKLALVKNGTGSWNFSQAANVNTFSGGVTLNVGTLTATKTSAFGTGVLTINGGSIAGVLSSNALTISGTVINGNFGWSAAATLGAGGVSLGTAEGTSRLITNTGYLQIDGVISDGDTATKLVTTNSSGTLVLNNANTFSGGLSFHRGNLTLGNAGALGSGDLTITTDTSSTLNATDGLSFANKMILAGFVTGGTGNITWTGDIVNSGNSRNLNRVGTTDITGNIFLSEASGTGRTLTLGGTNNGSGSVSGIIANYDGGAGTAGNLIKLGTGKWTLTGANTFTGSTTLGSSGGTDAGRLEIEGSGKVGGGQITVYAGTMDLNGTTQTINTGVQLGGGASGTSSTLDLGTGGSLSIGGTVTYSASNNPNGGTISGGTINLVGNRIFNVGDSSAASLDLTVSSIVANGDATARTVRKQGAGVLVVSGANTYSGTTTVEAGVLNIQNATALGTTAAGTTVNSGTALQIQGGITVGAEALALNGTGVSNDGALRNISGDNTYGGTITNSTAARINSDSGTLTLAGGINATNKEITFGGAGNIVVSGAMTNSTAGLTKDGTGVVTLSGANTYSGATTVSGGILTFLNTGAKASGTATATADGTIGLGVGAVSGDYTSADVASLFNSTLTGFSLNAASGVAIDTTSGNFTQNDALTASRALTKLGANTLTLSAANTYSGATTVSAGTLSLDRADGAALASTASVSVASGATLLIARSDQVNNSAGITLSGGTIQRASSASEVFGNLNITTASFLDFGSGTAGTLQFQNYSNTESSLVTVANFFPGNKLQFTSSSFGTGDLANFSFSSGYTTGTEGSYFTITAIPETSTVVAAIGLAGMILWPTRRRLLKDLKSILGIRRPASERLKRQHRTA